MLICMESVQRRAICLLGLLGVAAMAGTPVRAGTGPSIPRERIPADAPPDVRRPLEQLYSRDAVTRGYGAFAIGRLGDRAEVAVPFLIAMLDDDAKLEWEVKDPEPLDAMEERRRRAVGLYEGQQTSPGREAARALAILCAKAPPALVEALKSPEAAVRRNAAEALGGIRDKVAVAPLTALLRDEETTVRERAAYALGRLRDTGATEALIAAMKDPERSVRKHVVIALGEIKDPRALDTLLAGLLDALEVSAAAEQVLLETRDLRAVEPLIVSLRHRKAEVRRLSARLLAAIGDPRAFRPLIIALKDKASDVQFEAAAALRKMSGQDFGTDHDRWQRWYELDLAGKEIEEKVPDVHGYIGYLHNPGWAFRAYAAVALGRRADRRAVTALRGALWDKDAAVRAEAAKALGEIRDPRATEALIASVSDADPEVQEAAETALRRITGANFARDARKWTEWWDENRESVYARDARERGKEWEWDLEDEEKARRIEEEAPPRPVSRLQSLTLLGILLGAAVLPIAALMLLRTFRRRPASAPTGQQPRRKRPLDGPPAAS